MTTVLATTALLAASLLPVPDLPDLSPFRRVSARGPAPGPEPPPRDDEFGRQLRRLGTMLRPKLTRPTPAGERPLLGARANGGGHSAASSPDGDDVAALFTARAEADGRP